MEVFKVLIITFKYWVRFQQGQTVNIPGNLEQPHGHKRHPQRGRKRCYAPKIQSHSQRQPKVRKERFKQFSWELETVGRTFSWKYVQSTFLSRHFLGAPIWHLSWLHTPAHSRQAENQVNLFGGGVEGRRQNRLQKSVVDLGEKWSTTNGTWKQIHKSQFEDLVLTIFSPLGLHMNARNNVKLHLSLFTWESRIW